MLQGCRTTRLAGMPPLQVAANHYASSSSYGTQFPGIYEVSCVHMPTTTPALRLILLLDLFLSQ